MNPAHPIESEPVCVQVCHSGASHDQHDPAAAYTVGRAADQLPELYVSGLDPDVAAAVLRDIAAIRPPVTVGRWYTVRTVEPPVRVQVTALGQPDWAPKAVAQYGRRVQVWALVVDKGRGW